MVDAYRQIQEDKRNIKDQLGQLPDKTTTGKWNYYEELHLEEQATLVKKRDLSGDNAIYGNADFGIYGTNNYGSQHGMLWGSTVYGIWDSAKWGPIRVGFNLGHPGRGILGEDQLGWRESSFITIRVTNPDNIFRERFREDTYEDSDNTTATWDTSNYNITFTNGEIVQSNHIARNGTSYSTATMTIQGTDITNLTLYLSADGGTNWEEITNNIEHNFSDSSTDGIKFKIVATGSATITYIKIEYS